MVAAVSPASFGSEVARRRTFAIISHPDAGKTTLTEKFLLYAGAIEAAGAVKARRDRRAATSDWMGMEQQRGISITSAALRFEYLDTVFNLLDTPGHRDFSEDTYRVLAAADCAVMVLDAAKGVEPQTLKLFDVCRARGIPLVSFINKFDRPGLSPLELLDNIEQKIGLTPVPVTWPVGIPGDFRGVIDRRTGEFHRFDKTAHGATIAPEAIIDADIAAEEEGESYTVATDEISLLDAVGSGFDPKPFLAGEATPVFFGSAVSNFGVRLLLEAMIQIAPTPIAREDVGGVPRNLDDPFSAFVFKVQANMDPNHRDRIAFFRVCSGRFERGMTAVHGRTGRPYSLKYAHQMFGQERATVDEAFPGDIIGVVNATDLGIGDSLYVDDPVTFPPIPSFAPEHFMVARNKDSGRYKQFRRGIQQLDEEGVVQVLRHPDRGDQEPILAAVGPMQFEVAQYRLEEEFGAPVELRSTTYQIARRTDESGAEALKSMWQAEVFTRSDGTLLALFPSRFQLERFQGDHPEVLLEILVAGIDE